MTEGKPIAKPMIDDATREKMALMFSGEVYLPDDVDGFFDLQAAQRDLQLELNATPLTHPKRRTERHVRADPHVAPEGHRNAIHVAVLAQHRQHGGGRRLISTGNG